MYYVVDGKTLVRQRQFGEPERLVMLGKILKFSLHRDGILILREREAEKEGKFVARRLKYPFDIKGLLRSRTSLFLLSEGKLEALEEGSSTKPTSPRTGRRLFCP